MFYSREVRKNYLYYIKKEEMAKRYNNVSASRIHEQITVFMSKSLYTNHTSNHSLQKWKVLSFYSKNRLLYKNVKSERVKVTSP